MLGAGPLKHRMSKSAQHVPRNLQSSVHSHRLLPLPPHVFPLHDPGSCECTGATSAASTVAVTVSRARRGAAGQGRQARMTARKEERKNSESSCHWTPDVGHYKIYRVYTIYYSHSSCSFLDLLVVDHDIDLIPFSGLSNSVHTSSR